MDRVYKSGGVAGAPDAADNASGPFPTAGNPAVSQPSTKPGPYWFHMITESLARVIEDAGLALDKNDLTLLRQAISTLSGASTGDAKLTFKQAADVGWVMMDDGTLGNAASLGTTRAHADTEALFTLLWTNIADANAPVSGGRGASAAADFAANKTIALPKSLGRALAVSGAGAGLTARALGQALGAETHVLTIAQMPSHTHTGIINTQSPTQAASAGSSINLGSTSNSTGGNAAHPIMQPTSFFNVMIKL